MKVLQIHDFFARGNSRYGFDLCRALVARGHEAHVLAAVGEEGPLDGSDVEGVRFHTYPFARSRNPAVNVLRAIDRNRTMTTRLQARYRFDVAHVNQPLCFFGASRSPAFHDVARKYTFHSPWAGEWRIARDEAAGLEPISALQFLIDEAQAWVRNYLEASALAASSGIALASRFMKERLKRFHPEIDDRKIHLLKIGVDTEKFRPSDDRERLRMRFGIAPNDLLLLTIRRLTPRMGIDNLLTAMPAVVAAEPRARLVVGGEGPLRAALERVAALLSCRDRVRFIGQVPEETIADWYAAADLFVLPTKDLEGFGMVIVESMACGTPVLGTPVGAIPEVIGPFDPEMVCGGTGSEALADGIVRVLCSGKLSPQAREACRRHALDCYRMDRIVESYERFLCA